MTAYQNPIEVNKERASFCVCLCVQKPVRVLIMSHDLQKSLTQTVACSAYKNRMQIFKHLSIYQHCIHNNNNKAKSSC